MGIVKYINTQYYPNETERRRLQGIQDEINSARAKIQNNINQSKDPAKYKYNVAMEYPKFYKAMRSRIRLIAENGELLEKIYPAQIQKAGN